MSWLIALIVGGIVGWIATSRMRADDRPRVLTVNIIIGLVGGVIGHWLFINLLGIGATAGPSGIVLWAVIWGIVGALILLSIWRASRAER